MGIVTVSVLVVVDAANFLSQKSLYIEILKALHLHAEKPSILVLNKVRLLKTGITCIMT